MDSTGSNAGAVVPPPVGSDSLPSMTLRGPEAKKPETRVELGSSLSSSSSADPGIEPQAVRRNGREGDPPSAGKDRSGGSSRTTKAKGNAVPFTQRPAANSSERAAKSRGNTRREFVERALLDARVREIAQFDAEVEAADEAARLIPTSSTPGGFILNREETDLVIRSDSWHHLMPLPKKEQSVQVPKVSTDYDVNLGDIETQAEAHWAKPLFRGFMLGASLTATTVGLVGLIKGLASLRRPTSRRNAHSHSLSATPMAGLENWVENGHLKSRFTPEAETKFLKVVVLAWRLKAWSHQAGVNLPFLTWGLLLGLTLRGAYKVLFPDRQEEKGVLRRILDSLVMPVAGTLVGHFVTDYLLLQTTTFWHHFGESAVRNIREIFVEEATRDHMQLTEWINSTPTSGIEKLVVSPLMRFTSPLRWAFRNKTPLALLAFSASLALAGLLTWALSRPITGVPPIEGPIEPDLLANEAAHQDSLIAAGEQQQLVVVNGRVDWRNSAPHLAQFFGKHGSNGVNLQRASVSHVVVVGNHYRDTANDLVRNPVRLGGIRLLPEDRVYGRPEPLLAQAAARINTGLFRRLMRSFVPDTMQRKTGWTRDYVCVSYVYTPSADYRRIASRGVKVLFKDPEVWLYWVVVSFHGVPVVRFRAYVSHVLLWQLCCSATFNRVSDLSAKLEILRSSATNYDSVNLYSHHQLHKRNVIQDTVALAISRLQEIEETSHPLTLN